MLTRVTEYSPVIFKLLQGEDVLVEVLLELLVGIVNVELLEPVHLEGERSHKNMTDSLAGTLHLFALNKLSPRSFQSQRYPKCQWT